MISLRLLLALTIVTSLGYSQCTGGLAGIPYAIAAEIGMERTDEAVAMSIAPIACSSDEVMSIHVEGMQTTSGCKDGESCMKQLAESAMKHVATEEVFAWDTEEILPTSIFTSVIEIIEVVFLPERSRAGPLFEQALLAAHITVKRE